MPTAPPPKARPANPRRGGGWRRVRRGLFWTAAGLAAAGLGLWMTRVPLLNAALARFAEVRIEGFEWSPGSAVTLRGVVFSPKGTGAPVFRADSLTSRASLTELRAGRLGAVTLENPTLILPAGEKNGTPPEPKAKAPASPPGAAEPVVSWDSLVIRGGKVTIGGAEADRFSLRGGLRWEGGPGAVFADGSTRATEQTLTLTDAVLNLRPEGGTLESLEIRAGALTLTAVMDAATRHMEIRGSALTAGAFQLTARALPPDPAAAASGNTAPGNPEARTPWLRSLTLRRLSAPGLSGEVGWRSAAAAPPATGRLTTALSVSALQWSDAGGLTEGEFLVEHSAATIPGALDAKNLTASLFLEPGGARLTRLAVEGLAVTDPARLPPLPGLDPATLPLPPKLSLLADLSLTDLAFGGRGGAGPQSAAVQEITLREVSASLADASSARVSRFRLAVSPDEFRATGRVRVLEIAKPEIVWNGQTPFPAPAAASVGPPPAPGAAPPVSAGESGPGPVLIDSLNISDGTVRLALPETNGAVLTAGFRAGESAENPGDWLAEATGVSVTHPDGSGAPLYEAEAVRVSASPEDLWTRRRIRSAGIVGSRLEIGEGFFRMLRPAPGAEEEAEAGSGISKFKAQSSNPGSPEPPVSRLQSPVSDLTPSPVWRLGRLTLEDTRVRLDNLGDGRRLEIPISRQVFNALPLDMSALAAVDRVYQVEVPNITIYSPWREGQKVAVLDSNYVRFSPSGILNRRLEGVELMSPSLYAGQPLFDYVEATRKRFAELAAAGAPRPLLAAADKGNPTVLEAAASVRPGAEKSLGWVIPFYADSGKVIVAPKGNPWTDVPVFPFRNARGPDGKPVPFLLNGETFHGELAVAPGWYDFPEMKLRVRLSDRGRIVFNSPVKDQDNNLVEVFENNTVIWRQLQVEKVWLAVTYDKTGIYAKFGGETCGGYITGAVNLYLDELYTWDGSVSFTKIDMKPITDKLTPEYFRMGGVVDELTVHAYGDMNSLYQASGELKVSRPGRLEIIALDALREEMRDFGSLSRQLGEIGVDTLRSFDFTSCGGSLKLFGSEGTAQLRLKGPEGSRNFNINLHDYRARLPKSAIRF